jgi:hypothetical protein
MEMRIPKKNETKFFVAPEIRIPRCPAGFMRGLIENINQLPSTCLWGIREATVERKLINVVFI